MSLLSQASLVVTPSAYKEGKLYSVIPSDGSGDMSVVRATTATRVNSAGLVELVPYNLLQYSEQFSNAVWSKLVSGTGSTIPVVTANYAISPDGTQNASRLQCTLGSSGYSMIQQSFTLSGTHTGSIWVKSNTSSNQNIYLRFSSNTITCVVTPTWTRIDLTATTGDYLTIGLRDVTGYTNYSCDISIWGAQLVEGSVAKDYQKTETRLNIPRLDYSNGTCPSILVEPQRTNVLLYSNNFNNYPTWYFSNTLGTLTANDTISPQGINNATKIHFVDGVSDFIQQISIPSGTTRVFSIYLKGTIGETINIGFGGGSTQTITFTGDWQRCIVTSTTGIYVWIGTWGGMTARDLWMYGAQCEIGSYPTSYIPTTSASVTRNADVISKTGISSLIGQTEGTLFVDFVLKNPILSTNRIISITESVWSSGGSIRIDITNFSIAVDFVNGGVSVASFTYIFTPLPNTRYKIALAYKENDCKMYVNGVDAGSDTSTGAMPTCSEFYLNALGGGFNAPYEASNINAAALWKTRLDNATLAQLTTI